MTYVNPEALVSTEWLADHLNAPDVRVIDATYFLPTSGKNALSTFEEGHIPSAQFFDIDDIADQTSSNPHMLPDAAKFSARVRKLGLGDGNRIVVYDNNSSACAAARVWWMFRTFGHGDIAVLNGGFGKWLAEDRPVETGPANYCQERHFMARINNFLVRDVDQMKRNIESKRDLVVDARDSERFAARGVEPWPVIKSGHIPGALNVPFMTLLDSDNHGTFKSADQLKKVFEVAGVNVDQPIVCSCGSGVTAAVPALALYLLGNKDVAVYDGSWAEWGKLEDTPVEA